MNTEAEIIEKVVSGDSDAFEALVTKYEKQIYAMGMRYTGNQQDAMDITQEVFLRVFRFIKNFNAQSSFSTWIYRITVNVCKDILAKKRRIQELPLDGESEDGEYTIDIEDFSYSPEAVMQSHQLRDSIASAIAKLPEKYRNIIIMRELNDMSYEDIGRVLDIEQGTVKSRISRGREKLRLIIQNEGNIL